MGFAVTIVVFVCCALANVESKVSEIIADSPIHSVIVSIHSQAGFSISGKKIECVSGPLLLNLTCNLDTTNATAGAWSLDAYFIDGLLVDNIIVSRRMSFQNVK